ncbi:MAG: acireductone synthase [Gammaproteobacteria bacterium]|nr:acireductone synthase [Gammaproteobacteria bacterium]
MTDFSNISAIVTDISGTTSSIEFIDEVLFPYAQNHLISFVKHNPSHPSVQECLLQVAQEVQVDVNNHDVLLHHIQQCLELNVKSKPLKVLQSLVLQNGYLEDHFQSHIYKDAHQQLHHWQQQDLQLFSYSSASVNGQKWFFKYSQEGDLQHLFSGHFDTRIGQKQESAAYANIIQILGKPAEHILFLSDLRQELDAARQAGLQTCQVIREASQPLTSPHPCVRNFNGIKLG